MFAAVWPTYDVTRFIMSIWGKILGGAAGFAIGGPIGALVGGLAGHAVDVIREDGVNVTVPDGTRQIAFTIAVIALGAKMAKADGAVTRPEIDAFRQVFRVPEDEVRNVAFVFDRAKQDVNGFEAYATQVGRLFRGQPNVLEDLLDGLFHIAKADGEVHTAELQFLAEVARIFGFDAAAFSRIREAHLGPDAADPYAVLGLRRDAGDDEIRRKWRELAREHHPDLLVAQGLPPEFVAVANERLARINDAYDRIQKARADA